MIHKISLNDALEFVAQNEHGDKKVVVSKRPQCFGIKDSNDLISVAIFSNPMTYELQKRYTTELALMISKDTSQYPEILEQFIQHYQELPKSVDILVRDEILIKHAEVLQRCAMEKLSIHGKDHFKWNNPKIRFYTYKITSIVDDCYYYGRHQTPCTTTDEMLNDGYMGSGGLKFQNWIKSVGNENLRKNILEVHETWEKVVKAEEELIGDKHKTDEQCKNSKPGGTGVGSYFPTLIKKNCVIHGEAWHQGNNCRKCTVRKAFTSQKCSVHGSTIFQGTLCLKCHASKTRILKICEIHGETKHNGNSCNTCLMDDLYNVKFCEVHGEVVHMGNTCKSCVLDKNISMRECSTHGLTKHFGDRCRRCINASNTIEKICVIHGLTAHQSNTCAKCIGEKSSRVDHCTIHGTTTFKGSKCSKCLVAKIYNTQFCSTHGETKFKGRNCVKCQIAKIWTVEECAIHGESKHRSGKCVKCSVAKRKNRK